MKLYRGGQFAVCVGDITQLAVDAFVELTGATSPDQVEQRLRDALTAAYEAGQKTIALPPTAPRTTASDRPVAVVVTTARAWLDEHPGAFERVFFCCASDDEARAIELICDVFLR